REGRAECRERDSSFRGATLQGHGGEDESVVGRHVTPATGAAPQSAAASAAGAGPSDPSWRPSDP
ncbi:hypothetical protein KI387_040190, partial [Taxus chinensis]